MLRPARIGYFGKIPAAGDFVSRNIDRTLREAIDTWLQQSLEQSRSVLGGDWLASFLRAPVWRFVCAGLSGSENVVAGIMIPSVDRVGRYFPFAMLAEVEGFKPDAASLAACDALLGTLQPLAIGVLEEEFDPLHFDHMIAIAAKRLELASNETEAGVSAGFATFEDAADLDRRLASLDWRSASVWWTDGSDFRQAELLLLDDLPTPNSFASLLRDPNAFADLEALWNDARDLGMTQSDNGSIEAGLPAGDWPVHLIAHCGKSGGANVTYGDIGIARGSVYVCDGRFGTAAHAMVSRFTCRFVQKFWTGGQLPLPPEEVARAASFLSVKLNAGQTNLMPPLSFACAVPSPAQAGLVQVVSTGGYLCVASTAHGAVRLFAGDDAEPGDGPTVRNAPSGLYACVSLPLRGGETLLIANAAVAGAALADGVVMALGKDGPNAVAHALLEEALIRGSGGNIALAVVRRATAA